MLAWHERIAKYKVSFWSHVILANGRRNFGKGRRMRRNHLDIRSIVRKTLSRTRVSHLSPSSNHQPSEKLARDDVTIHHHYSSNRNTVIISVVIITNSIRTIYLIFQRQLSSVRIEGLIFDVCCAETLLEK